MAIFSFEKSITMLIKKIAQFAEGDIEILSKILGIVAIGVLVAMMLFTVLDVVLRAFFNRPIRGDVELIEVGMVCTSFLGLAWCAMKGMHIKVDLVVSFLPTRVKGIIDIFGYLLGVGICALLAWQGFLEGIANLKMNNVSATLEFPIFPFYWVVALGFAALCLAILVLLTRSLAEVIQG
jgi:TRAP-type C4-dicarboxylate transport system permease small subunit